MRAPRRIALAALVAAAACGKSAYRGTGTCPCTRANEVCYAGRCIPIQGGTYRDPEAVPATCLAPALASGGLNAVPDPGGACLRPVESSALPLVPPATSGAIDLGVRTVGETVSFGVPAGTASVTIIEEAVSAIDSVTILFPTGPFTVGNIPTPNDLRDPGHPAPGAPLYDDFLPAPLDGSANLVFFAGGGGTVGSLTVPDTSKALADLVSMGALPAGMWQFTVSDLAWECWVDAQGTRLLPYHCDAASQRNDGAYRVLVLTKALPAAATALPDTGTLDVAFHLVDTLSPATIGISAAQAPLHPATQLLVAAFARLLANAGVCLGTVTFYDEPDWARTLFATGVDVDSAAPCGSLNQLFALSTPGTDRLELFLVSRLVATASGGGTVIGVDGTIPGPATVNGTVQSGAVVSAADLLAVGSCPSTGFDYVGCGPHLTGYVAAHEAGHYLGLYHPTEQDGIAFDPVADTPHCECVACSSNSAGCGAAGNILGADRCNAGVEQCSGARNLMFWILSEASASGGILSPDQGRIVRESPVVRFPEPP